MSVRTFPAIYKDDAGRFRYVKSNKFISRERLDEYRDMLGVKVLPITKEVEVVKIKRERIKPPTAIELALKGIPPRLRDTAKGIANDPMLNGGIMEMMGRWTEFSSSQAAFLAGIALHPQAREVWDDLLDSTWEANWFIPTSPREVVIGAGLSAAIYSAVRVKMGHPPPVVLERRERVGGVFALSRKPSFFLNSRNRPGPLSIPGDPDGSLNVLPGCMIQPSDIDGNEYMTNTTMAWIIRTNLAMYANVFPNAEVEKYSPQSSGCTIRLTDGRLFRSRVIDASGLSTPYRLTTFRTERLLLFEEFMAMMDSPFPLRGMKRVAVIGAGDSGRTAIEALTGKGPRAGMSVARLDWPDVIDWYGVPGDQRDRKGWEACNRSRYKGIASLLSDPTPRVRALGKAENIYGGYETIIVDETPYDYVIECLGYDDDASVPNGGYEKKNYVFGKRIVAKRTASYDAYLIGVVSQIDPTESEKLTLRGVAENSTSIFRYAGRTAALAASLS